ncbi:MAG: hypothetical protein QOK29_1873 [Rhodospirillaceae bacterium]|nr:hypothetical protein [Rhodospirillaceae bacterium]
MISTVVPGPAPDVGGIEQLTEVSGGERMALRRNDDRVAHGYGRRPERDGWRDDTTAKPEAGDQLVLQRATFGRLARHEDLISPRSIAWPIRRRPLCEIRSRLAICSWIWLPI